MQDVEAAIHPTAPQPTTTIISAHEVAKRARFVFGVAIGFYLYALTICGFFVGAGWLLIAAAGWITKSTGAGLMMCLVLPLAILFFGSALLILWSLVPRPRRFRAPGVRLDLPTRPALQAALADIAARTNQQMPAEVYVNLGANAAVTERGGILGANKRRVLFLGLPLFSLLTVPQFKSVLAHEFGHFYWGDTRLGPWLYRAERAISNTIEVLHDFQYTAWINLLLFGYAEWFMEITRDLRRKKEFLADQLAAKTAGKKATIESLHLMRVGEDALDTYWSGTIVPLLDFGVRPPLLEGFRRFLSVQTISSSVLRNANAHLKADRTEEFHTHPAFPERVAAIAQLPTDEAEAERQPDEQVPALSLLGDPADLETTLIGVVLGKKEISRLKPVIWEDACTQAYVPMWQDMVRTFSRGLEGVTPEALPDLVKNLSTFGMQMIKKANQPGELESLTTKTSAAIGSALALALRKAGWELSVSPGQPVCARRGESRIEPFEVMGRLVARRLNAEEWRTQCQSAGIAGIDLGKLTTA
jgi:Zn-dependent protease with chaperone function